jgi:DNA-binding transcriptional LysR family regulator
MIKQLETRLGLSLLTRTTRSTHLSEAGERFLNEAGPAVDQILAAIKGVDSYAQKPSGLLRINLPRSTFHPYIQPLLYNFTKKYPDITIELFFEDQTSDVNEGGFDAGIRHSDILAKDMIAIKIAGPIRFVVAGSKRYFEAAGRPKQPKDLLSHNCIRFRFGTSSIYDRWEFEHKGRDKQVHVKGSLILNDPELSSGAAARGVGLIYTIEDAIKSEVKSGKLEIVLEQFAPVSSGYYLYYPSRSQTQPKLRAFVDHIQSLKK